MLIDWLGLDTDQTRGVIYDYAGVLGNAQTPDDYTHLAHIADVPADEFTGQYWDHRVAYDLGAGDLDYWTQVLGRQPDPTTLDSLVAADVASLLKLNTTVVRTARELSERGLGVVVLSNAPTPLARAVERLPELSFIDTFLFSCDIHAVKPDTTAFEAACRHLGLNATQCVFVDDRTENLDAAANLGITPVLVENHDAHTMFRPLART